MREWLARMADRLRRDRLDAELAEELRFHRERLERDLRQAGAGPDAARDLARRRLGNPTRVREEARERWSLPALDPRVYAAAAALLLLVAAAASARPALRAARTDPNVVLRAE